MNLRNFNGLGWAIILVSLALSFVVDMLLRYTVELKAGVGVVISFVLILVGLGLALRFGVKQKPGL